MHVSRTRLQLSQKLWVIGVMNPTRVPVSATSKYRAGPPVLNPVSVSVNRCRSRARTMLSGKY